MDWWPSAVPFDPEAGAAFHTISEVQAGVAGLPGAAALVAGRDARASGWAAKTAIAIADAIARTHRVILVDMDFDDPRLHEAAGTRNDEGLSDIALFGASLAGVSRPVAGKPIHVVAAGPFVPDVDEAAASVPWPRILAEAADSGAKVLFYIPAERFTAEVSEIVPDAVFLGGTKDAWEADRDWPPAGVVALAVAPPVPPLEEPAGDVSVGIVPVDEPEEVAPEAVDEDIREALIADLRARQHSALDADVPPVETIDLTEPPPPELDSPLEDIGEPTFAPPTAAVARLETRPSHLRTVVVAGVTTALVAVLAGAWHFRRSFLPGDNATREQSAAPATAAQDDGAARPGGQPLAYSVAIEAHKHLPTATARVRTLSIAQPRIGFYTTPTLEDSVLWYKVMAGPLTDSTAAAGVLKELLSTGVKTGGNDWDIRSTPFAFLIGVFDTREGAERRMSELQQIDIPSYVVDVPYTGGVDRYHLYAGAYAAAAEAEVMREFLNSVGIPDSLVVRVGRAPS